MGRRIAGGSVTDFSHDAHRRFEAMVDLVYEPIQRYARRRCSPDSADDLVAEVLLVLWRRLDEVPTDAALPWCYRVAGNCLANLRRADRRRHRLFLKLTRVDQRPGPQPHEPPDPELHDALASLRSVDREVLRLWAWEGLSPAEIAAVLETSTNAATIRLHRAKRRLGTALGKVPSPPGHMLLDDAGEAT